MSTPSILSVSPLKMPWDTADPFMFCVHHDDAYPAGNAQMGPDATLRGRRIGMDFSGLDGWSMYHGEVVPGFPQHPHCGFETVTLARRGFIDHSDSLGATARFGRGDCQWMTAGGGVLHAEMFPLLEQDGPNPLELFQLWLNLPAASKGVEPYFTMMWSEGIPRHSFEDEQGRKTHVTTIAGHLAGQDAPTPPPDSWASDPRSRIAIWTLAMEPGARWTLPAAEPGLNRSLYYFVGDGIEVDGQAVGHYKRVQLRPDAEVPLVNGDSEGELLMLQGRPIGEPVVQHGPFVANSPQGIQEAYRRYQRTGFGGWPWDSPGPVHPKDKGRFAVHADGRVEEAG